MAEQHLDSSSSSSTHSDDALKLFVSAPWWLYCTSWKLAKPENVGTESCTFKVTGPVSSEEMMQLYRGKRLKGSVLMVGLTQAAKDMRPGQDLPASVYRTLAHLFEMSRNGVPYTPVDCDGVKNGMSAASWARPLWTICEPSLPSGPVPKADEEDEDEATQGSTQEEGDKDADDQAEEVEDSASEGHKCPPSEDVSMAVRLLNSAPSWCYLYSHEPLKSKKTPPKTSAHMVDMYKSGCLPEWTPLLGLRQNVAHFNSLPPSLFTTLGALLTVLQAGLELQPVGLVELQRYDKFIECRNHVGSTMRAPSTDTLHGASSGSVPFNRRTPSGTQSVDGITKNLPGVATSTSNGKSGTANNTSNSQQPPSAGQTAMTSPSHAAWAQAASSTPGGSESPGTPGQAPYPTPESPVVAPYGMPLQQHMHVYQAMLPTWLWGVPHMPYTFMAPPGAAGSPTGHPLHSMPSAPQSTITASPARRSAGSKQRSGAGNRGPASTPGSPATTANPAAPAGAPISSPGNGAAHNNHRLAHSSVASVGGARSIITSPTSVSGTLHPLGSHAASLLVAPGVPAQQHPLVITPSMMTPDAASAAMQAGLWGWPGTVPAAVAAPTAAGAAAVGGAGAGGGSSPWQTSLFRLFMADCSRGLDVPVWWYLENKTSGTVVGPLGCEAMIMAYARGTLTEQHMVCGTHSDVTAACPPAREFFEELGGLLRQVEAGGSYVLVSQAEVTRHASLAVFSAGGSGGSLGGASNGRQSGKAGKRSNKANGLQSMGSAPIPPRTPTSTQATSPRPEGTDPNSSTPPATMESWTSSQGVPRCSPSNGRTKNSSRQSNPNTRNTTSPTQPAASSQSDAPTTADASATIVAIKAASAGVAQPTADELEQVDLDAEASRFRGLSVHVPAARETAAAAAAATAEWVESHDTAFTSREAVQAAAAAASMAISAVPQAVVVVQSDVDLRGRSGGGTLGSAEQGSLTPRTVVTLGSGVQQVTVQQTGGALASAGESGRVSCCSPGVRDQLRKSSRGGAPLSVKNSFEEDQTKSLMHLNGGVELRDSDDDVRGPAARDAHDSRNCSFGGATGNANGQGLVVTVGPAAAGIAPASLA